MSRRERDVRDSDSRRHRSGLDRESSPKRSRRDGKQETQRAHRGAANLDVGREVNGSGRRFHDGLPLEAASGTVGQATAPVVESSVLRKESFDNKSDGNDQERKHLSYTIQVSRSRSHFQQDERGNAGQVGRSISRRAATDRERSSSKDNRNEWATNKSVTYDLQRQDDKSQPKAYYNGVSRHDGFLKMEAEPPPPLPPRPLRKRPAFTEKKIRLETESSEKEATGPGMHNHSDRAVSASERKEERARNIRPYLERSGKPITGGRRDAQQGGIPSRDRYHGAGNYMGKEKDNRRQDYRPGGMREEKWKHDLFNEDGKTPNTKNEEDQIAEVEALLASQ